jgi:ElaB/YqjD/DUF883 family membrane-anchored ribosome-binding protein
MTANPDSESEDTTAARHAIRDGIDNARAHVNDAAQSALTRTKDGLEHARGAVSEAYSSSRERAAGAYATAREKARSAGRSAADGMDQNPLAALLGGLALGAVIGALLPRTEREGQLLGAAGEKIRGAAREAGSAAREAGQEKLAELGISRDHARDTIKSLLDGVIAAAGHAGSAAVESARKGRAE